VGSRSARTSALSAERYVVRERHGDPRAENMLVHGDNLDALGWMLKPFARTFACVYLDPPFNSGRTFAEYKDALEPERWLSMMRPRLEAILPLVRDDGAVFVEIDDTMIGELSCLMDDVMGKDHRLCTITIVRSAPTGHKAKNRGPVNVTDYLLVYEKTRAAWRYRPQTRVRKTYDAAYSTWVPNAHEPSVGWRFEPLARHVAHELGFASAVLARRTLGKSELDRRVAEYALAHAESVVRFAQPRFEAISRDAQALILRSRAEPERVFCLERAGYPDMVLYRGNRILCLANKVRSVDGAPRIVEPLTNVWDDLGFQGIAREGDVVFSRNKKPERLLARVVAMATEPGDWVLDAFAGSGTTAAVAHKMKRRWVGIEQGEQLWDLCVPRLRRVVDGTDGTGISASYGWKGGGGFAVYA
jgi:adenine-specific DNA-methyltransferase